MLLKKRERVVGRGPDAVFSVSPVSQQKGLKHVHHLRNVAHIQLVRLAVEDVEPEAGGYRAPHRALLPEFSVSLLIFLGNLVPYTPLVENKTNLPTLFVAVEHRPLMNDGLLHLCIRCELLVHVLDRKVCGEVRATRIVMHGHTLGPLPAEAVHEPARPSGIVARRATRDQEEFRAPEIATIHCEIAVESRIFFGTHVAAAAPAFIAHSPVTNAEWLGRSVGRALLRKCAA